MNIKHIDFRTSQPCFGILMMDGLTIWGMRYKCTMCGKEFIVDSKGKIVL